MLWCVQVPSKVHVMQPRHVANTSWAFAVRKAYSPPLYDALAARMVQLIERDRGHTAVDTSSSSSSDSSIDATSSRESSSSGGSSTDSSTSDSSSSSSSSDSSIDSLFLSEHDIILPHHLSLVAWSFAKQVGMEQLQRRHICTHCMTHSSAIAACMCSAT
jgi:hypothetical protein